MGELNTFSFFPTKNLGCFGDGGAVSTNDQDLALKASMISRHGQGQKYSYDLIGCNSRLDTIQAAILRIKLRNLGCYLQSRISAGLLYNQLISGLTGVVIPSGNLWSKHTYNQYVIRTDQRDTIRELLKAAGVPSMIYYPSPLHLQKAYAYLGYKKGDFPVAEKLCLEVLALPIHTEITPAEQEFVVNSIKQSINSL